MNVSIPRTSLLPGINYTSNKTSEHRTPRALYTNPPSRPVHTHKRTHTPVPGLEKLDSPERGGGGYPGGAAADAPAVAQGAGLCGLPRRL